MDFVKKSTSADANNRCPAEFFQAFFEKSYQRCAALAPGKKKFRFPNKLYSWDASTIDLCLSVFPLAKFRSTKRGIKLHTVLVHDGYIPRFARITDAKTSDLTYAGTLTLQPDSIVAADRAHADFAWLFSLNKWKKYLVARLKKNIKYKIVERRSVLKSKEIISDQTIILTGSKAYDCLISLYRVDFKNPDMGKQYFFLANNFHLAVNTIFDIYKDHWQIERFFKWFKENLKIKTFLGTNKNTVMTQIWVAITQRQRLLHLNMFKSKSLWELFDPPLIKGRSDKTQKNPILVNYNQTVVL